MDNISWSDFEKIEVRAGTVVEVKEFPEARKPAFKGKQVICVVNFPSKQIGPFVSQCLVTGLYREDGSVVLAVPDHEVSNGAKFG